MLSPLSKPVLYSVVAPCLMLRSSKANQPLCSSLPTRTCALYAPAGGVKLLAYSVQLAPMLSWARATKEIVQSSANTRTNWANEMVCVPW
jgi:hypothetical protein